MRITASERITAVAGAPHVTNRTGLLPALQSLEASSIIGLIRRTHALPGRVGVVAGVLGIFRRDAVLAVGGYDGRMATEDIDLLAAPPRRLAHAVRAERARRHGGADHPAGPVGAAEALSPGPGRSLHEHFGAALAWRNRSMWPLALESIASLFWVCGLALALVLAVLALVFEETLAVFGFGVAWGIAIAVIALVQLAFAIAGRGGTTGRPPRLPRRPALPARLLDDLGSSRAPVESPAVFRGPHRERVGVGCPRVGAGSD